MKNKKTILGSLVAASIVATQVNAQEAGLSAEVDSRLSYEDNILRTSDANAESDTSLVVAPEVTLAGIMGKQRFSARYIGEYANYFDNSDVNYADHSVRLRADLDHSNRLTSRFDVEYRDVHEDVGDLNTIFDDLTEFNTYTEKLMSGLLRYARQDSFGQLVFGLGHAQRDYENNAQEFRSYDRDLASLAFYYRIASKTRLLAELIYQNYDFDPQVGFVALDSTYVTYQAGVEWALTNKLEGAVKVGYLERDYDADSLNDIDGLAYSADLEYKPNSYSTINLAAKREGLDSSLEGVGGFIRDSYSISVNHSLTELTKVDGKVYYAKDDGVFGGTRQDDRLLLSVGLTHSLLTWVELGANVSREERDSTVNAADYTSNSINLTAKVSFN